MPTPYRPSNGSEGEGFCERYCYRCVHDINEDCAILANSLAYNIGDPKYPAEWVQNDGPRCTAFLAIGDDAETAAARADPRQLPLL